MAYEMDKKDGPVKQVDFNVTLPVRNLTDMGTLLGLLSADPLMAEDFVHVLSDWVWRFAEIASQHELNEMLGVLDHCADLCSGKMTNQVLRKSYPEKFTDEEEK